MKVKSKFITPNFFQNFIGTDALPAAPQIEADVLQLSPVWSDIETSESETTSVPMPSESESDHELEDVIESSDDDDDEIEANETLQYGDPTVPKGLLF